LKMVWHDDVCVLDRTVDVNITRVRKKIGRYGVQLVSRQGYGYSFKS
jgi:DNA-binding response OmpR family regulator